ncbi:MAG TPA: DUF4286 domain-containing protein, partial [Flavobacterium sp.]|nr:DUF4286 domain-containing protein [Flavobacterium sp.]
MIIYNVTINIEQSIQEQWLQWMQNKHIADVLATGIFNNARLVKVLVDEDDGVTYSVQYFCDSKAKLNEYYKKYAHRLQQDAQALFGNKIIAFRTELEVLGEYFNA